MTEEETREQIRGIALLGEPVRRSLYEYVAAQSHDVGREEAARAVGVSRALAAFHLDRLAEEGLLDVAYRRLSDRRGPGAGRPSKVYRRSGARLEVSIPRRRYQLVARLLAVALERVGRRGATALEDAAAGLGRELGAEARGEGAASVEVLLADNGFEPSRTEGGTIVLRNCPFEAVAREFTGLVCGANLAFMQGVLDGAGATDLRVFLDPEEGRCCAVFAPTG